MDEKFLDKLPEFLSSGKLTTLVPLLPLLLNLEGKPYSLVDHFPFEPLFDLRTPTSIVFRTGRQISKTTSIAARGVVLSAAIPYFSILYVTPLFDQVRKISTNYFRPFVESSPVKSLMIDKRSENSVLQRTFRNQSRVHFNYALLSADRIRGTSAKCCFFDEAQDLDHTLVPVIKEVLSHSDYGELVQYTGTPKTLDNNLEVHWDKSSQSHWVMRCGCGKWNIASLEHDLLKLIGPYRDDISEDRPATICAKCGNFINPRFGRWIPKYRDKHTIFAGYHIPQIIIPLHYSKPHKWRILLSKQAGLGSVTKANFLNEVLGEACDLSTKLINKTDLLNASVLHKNDERTALSLTDKYIHRSMGIDWGGGGEKGDSLTAISIQGMLPDGRIEVIFGERLLTPHDHLGEAEEARRLFNAFKCHILAHDYTGAGDIRQTLLVHRNVPLELIMPVHYIGPCTGGILNFKQATYQRPINYWTADKTRSLQLVCYAIKFGRIKFFKYDYISPEEPGVLHDFLNLIELKIARPGGSDQYTIQKSAGGPDDFAHAVNLGCCALWHRSQQWPNFSGLESLGNIANIIDTQPRVQPDTADMMGGYFDRY